MDRTRVVRWLRVILPLAALAVLSTLFLLARRPDPDAAIPYAQGGMEDLARTPGMTAPEFSTVTADGATVTLGAARADPASGGGTAQEVRLDWTARDGTGARLAAASARQKGDSITLDGQVDAALTTGWRLTAPSVQADLQGSVLTAAGPVAVTAPFGTLDAGGMVLSALADGRHVLELNRGVRLLYRP